MRLRKKKKKKKKKKGMRFLDGPRIYVLARTVSDTKAGRNL
jgi:hypothetical protein